MTDTIAAIALVTDTTASVTAAIVADTTTASKAAFVTDTTVAAVTLITEQRQQQQQLS